MSATMGAPPDNHYLAGQVGAFSTSTALSGEGAQSRMGDTKSVSYEPLGLRKEHGAVQAFLEHTPVPHRPVSTLQTSSGQRERKGVVGMPV